MYGLEVKGSRWGASSFFNNLILGILIVSMLISDWLLGPFAISEFITAVALLLLMVSNKWLIARLNIKYLIVILFFFLMHVIFHYIFNPSFVIKTALYGIIKILFFSVFVNMVVVFIKEKDLELKFLKFLNFGAIIAIVIGLYITLAILLDGILPYNFFWEFTRSSSFSYVFKDTDIIRTKSLFSEPAHLGYYLLIVLGMNLFSKYKKDIHPVFNFGIIIGIISTLSYSSLAILIIIIGLKCVFLLKKIEYKNVSLWSVVLPICITVLVIYIFKDFLFVTFIERTIQMINGTDNSASNRIIESWSYVNRSNILIGKGIGHTPSIQNIYAYFLSDLGILAFCISLCFSFILLKENVGIGLVFILLNFQKGGYLSPIFALFVLTILVFTNINNNFIISKMGNFYNRRK